MLSWLGQKIELTGQIQAPAALPPAKELEVLRRMRRWVGPGAGLHVLGNTNRKLLPEIEPSTVKSVA